MKIKVALKMTSYAVEEKNGRWIAVPAKASTPESLAAVLNPIRWTILNELAAEAQYPSQLANKLKVNEQKIFYHINQLKKAGLVHLERREEKQGGVAKYFKTRELAFVLKLREADKFASEFSPAFSKTPSFLKPFVSEGQLNAAIVVGSPDPHGPNKARSRDGRYAADLALFLGAFVHGPAQVTKSDTELKEEEKLQNLMIVGGPVTNLMMDALNDSLPVRFDRNHNWDIISDLSKTHYPEEECGLIVQAPNPLNPKAQVLVLAGKRFSGTKTAVLAFVRHFDKIQEGNKFNPKVLAHVVDGVDLDGDGVVDSVEIRE